MCFGTEEVEHPAELRDEHTFSIIASFHVPKDGVAMVTTVLHFSNPKVHTATPAGRSEQFYLMESTSTKAGGCRTQESSQKLVRLLPCLSSASFMSLFMYFCDVKTCTRLKSTGRAHLCSGSCLQETPDLSTATTARSETGSPVRFWVGWAGRRSAPP